MYKHVYSSTLPSTQADFYAFSPYRRVSHCLTIASLHTISAPCTYVSNTTIDSSSPSYMLVKLHTYDNGPISCLTKHALSEMVFRNTNTLRFPTSAPLIPSVFTEYKIWTLGVGFSYEQAATVRTHGHVARMNAMS